MTEILLPHKLVLASSKFTVEVKAKEEAKKEELPKKEIERKAKKNSALRVLAGTVGL